MNLPTSPADSVFSNSADAKPADSPFGRAYALLLHWMAYACLLVGLFVLVSTIYGVVVVFSPVPYMDQWNGYLGFWQAIQSADYGAWWRPHNEHRIVISRLLFWLDLKYFGGMNVSSVVATVVLHGATACVFLYAYACLAAKKVSLPIIVGVVLALRFSWVQGENLTWGFQSQFIAVFFFAALSFLVLSIGSKENGWRLCSVAWPVFWGVLSALSMTNGLFVMPLLACQCVILRLPWRCAIPFAVATVLLWMAYFHDYRISEDNGGLLSGLLQHPLGILWYFMVFMGGTASFLLPIDLVGDTLIGLVTLISMIGLGLTLYRRRLFTPYRSMLYAMYTLCVLSALMASVGRYSLGITTAVAARYSTPVLISWLCIFLLVMDLATLRWFWRVAIATVLCVMLPLASYQRHVLDDETRQEQYWRLIGVLGVKVGVTDPIYLDWTYPRSMQSQLVELAHYADSAHISIYGKGWGREVGQVRFNPTLVEAGTCQGSFEAVTKIPGGYRVRGWVYGKLGETALIVLANQTGDTVGYGLPGEMRPDVSAALPAAGKFAGWRGYAVRFDPTVSAYFYNGRTFCRLTTESPLGIN